MFSFETECLNQCQPQSTLSRHISHQQSACDSNENWSGKSPPREKSCRIKITIASTITVMRCDCRDFDEIDE